MQEWVDKRIKALRHDISEQIREELRAEWEKLCADPGTVCASSVIVLGRLLEMLFAVRTNPAAPRRGLFERTCWEEHKGAPVLIVNELHGIRKAANALDHCSDATMPGFDQTVTLYAQYLDVLEWFYRHREGGPKADSIFIPGLVDKTTTPFVGEHWPSPPDPYVSSAGDSSEVCALLDALRGDERVVAITGPRGAGKSSLLRAALAEVPKGEEGLYAILYHDYGGASEDEPALPEPEAGWLIDQMRSLGVAEERPGRSTGDTGQLREALRKLQERGRCWIVLDSFETLLGPDGFPRAGDAESLVRLLAEHGPNIKLIVATRTDPRLGECGFASSATIAVPKLASETAHHMLDEFLHQFNARSSFSQETLDGVVKRADGNPRFLREYARRLSRMNADEAQAPFSKKDWADLAADDLDSGFRKVVHSDYLRLSEPEQLLLCCCAVFRYDILGTPGIPKSVLMKMAAGRMCEDDASKGIERLVGKHWLAVQRTDESCESCYTYESGAERRCILRLVSDAEAGDRDTRPAPQPTVSLPAHRTTSFAELHGWAARAVQDARPQWSLHREDRYTWCAIWHYVQARDFESSLELLSEGWYSREYEVRARNLMDKHLTGTEALWNKALLAVASSYCPDQPARARFEWVLDNALDFPAELDSVLAWVLNRYADWEEAPGEVIKRFTELAGAWDFSGRPSSGALLLGALSGVLASLNESVAPDGGGAVTSDEVGKARDYARRALDLMQARPSDGLIVERVGVRVSRALLTLGDFCCAAEAAHAALTSVFAEGEESHTDPTQLLKLATKALLKCDDLVIARDIVEELVSRHVANAVFEAYEYDPIEWNLVSVGELLPDEDWSIEGYMAECCRRMRQFDLVRDLVDVNPYAIDNDTAAIALVHCGRTSEAREIVEAAVKHVRQPEGEADEDDSAAAEPSTASERWVRTLIAEAQTCLDQGAADEIVSSFTSLAIDALAWSEDADWRPAATEDAARRVLALCERRQNIGHPWDDVDSQLLDQLLGLARLLDRKPGGFYQTQFLPTLLRLLQSAVQTA